MRAVTFQSMSRMSSPGWYWRTSENAMPRPLNTEWYCPAMRSRASRAVTISILRMRLEQLARAASRCARALRDFDVLEELRTTVSAVTSSASAS